MTKPTESPTPKPPARWWSAILRDPHWWVPVIVLLGGLLVLQWIR